MQEGVKARIETTWNLLADALFAHKSQLIILSGSFPPHLIPAYQKQLQRDDLNVIREPSDRPNIAYHSIIAYVRAISDDYYYEDITQQLIASLMHHIEQSSTPTDRILVFFANRDTVEAFGTAHNYIWYHSHCTKTALADALESWDNLDCHVLVATTSMAQGLDRSNVRFVIAANIPYGVTTVTQMVGRAGRDGQPSDMFFVGPSHVPLPVDVRWHEDSMLAQHHLNTTSACQREAMMISLDGPSDHTYQCFSDVSTAVDMHPCGTCAPLSAMHLLALQAVETARQAYDSRSPEVSIPARRVVTAGRNVFHHRSTSSTTSTSRRLHEKKAQSTSWPSQLTQERQEHRQNPRYSHSGEEMPMGSVICEEAEQDVSIGVRLFIDPTPSLITDTPPQKRQVKPWKTLSEHGASLPQAVVRALNKVSSGGNAQRAAQWVRFIN